MNVAAIANDATFIVITYTTRKGKRHASFALVSIAIGIDSIAIGVSSYCDAVPIAIGRSRNLFIVMIASSQAELACNNHRST